MSKNSRRGRSATSTAAVPAPETDHSVGAEHRPEPDRGAGVPVRTILTTIGLVLATALILLVIYETRRVLI